MNVASLHQLLPILKKEGYRLFSRASDKAPTSRSPYATTKGVEFADSTIERTIHHLDRSITIKVAYGWLRFWR